MDSSTYDEPYMSETPFNDDEMYTNLNSTQVKNPSYGIQRTRTNQTDGEKEVSSKYNPKYLVVLIVAIVILLVLVLASIALSVATYIVLSSEQSKLIDQIDKRNNETVSVLTQLAITQSNISRTLTQLEAKFNTTTVNEIRQSKTQCGPGLWYQLIYINMTDPSQQCPPAWREYNISGVRACGRPNTGGGSCETISYHIGRQYSRVCGGVIGFQYGSSDSFKRFANNDIDFDGINITHGVQHNHIWSYISGVSQSDSSTDIGKCPCTEHGGDPPQFLHDNYYCESGNPNAYLLRKLYVDDPLWDGQQCEGTCCNGTNSPPWFSVQLPITTTDRVEVSICCDEGTDNEDVPVKLIEIYVQ